MPPATGRPNCGGLKRCKGASGRRFGLFLCNCTIPMNLRLRLELLLLLQSSNRWPVHSTECGKLSSLEDTAVKSRTVVVKALSNNLAAANDNTAMSVMQR